MNEKDRIIELVRQNVISLEEALVLLEAVAKSEDKEDPQVALKSKSIRHISQKDAHKKSDQIDKFVDTILETGSQVTQKVSDYVKQSLADRDNSKHRNFYADEFKADQTAEEARWQEANSDHLENVETVEIDQQERDQEIARISKEIEEKKEKQLINQQRLRELEIFAELDDLTEEMQSQQTSLLTEKESLQADLEDLSATLADLYQEKAQAMNTERQVFSEENKEYLKNKADDISRFTAQLADDAIRGGKQVTQGLGQQFKEIMKNFDRKDINLSFEVPWIKTQEIQHSFEFAGEAIKNIHFKLNNGSLKVEKSSSDKIMVAGDLRFHGNFDRYDADEFAKLSTIDAHGDSLIFQVNSPRLSADLTLSLPDQVYEKLQISLLNGEGQMEDIQAEEIDFQDKNGNLLLKRLKAPFVNVMNLNGDILLEEMASQDIVAKTLSGDIRIKGSIENLNASTSAGDIYISKRDKQASHIQANTTSGDIKISQPADLNLQIKAASTTGNIYRRLSGIDTFENSESSAKTEFQRQIENQEHVVTIDAKVVSGDIFLKDVEG